MKQEFPVEHYTDYIRKSCKKKVQYYFCVIFIDLFISN